MRPSQERKLRLKNDFGFECECQWCIEPTKTKTDRIINKYLNDLYF